MTIDSVVAEGVTTPRGEPWEESGDRANVAESEACFGDAQLAGAATAPAQRRRGVHGALLSARLADAAAGCDVAVITTQPGSKAQHSCSLEASTWSTPAPVW